MTRATGQPHQPLGGGLAGHALPPLAAGGGSGRPAATDLLAADADARAAASARRFGDVLAAVHFNIWPDILVRVAGGIQPGLPRLAHWERIGLDQQELLFLLCLLRYYRERAAWPVIRIDEMALMLGVSARQVQRTKNGLIADGYLRRIERANPITRERWPDGLDCSPLFALLEACAFLYHADELTQDLQPAWQPTGPRKAPLDPDGFGRRRRAAREQARGADGRRARSAPARGPRGSAQHGTNQGDTGDGEGGDTHVTQGDDPAVGVMDDAGGGAGRDTGDTRRRARSSQNPLPAEHHVSSAHTDPELSGLPPVRVGERVEGAGAAARPDLAEETATFKIATTGEPALHAPEEDDRYRDPELDAFIDGRAGPYRDDDPERSRLRAQRLWWNSGLPAVRFRALLAEAAAVTNRMISAGYVERGAAGRRHAMPYFFAVLEDLVRRERAAQAPPAARAS